MLGCRHPESQNHTEKIEFQMKASAAIEPPTLLRVKSQPGGQKSQTLKPITLLQPGRIIFGNGCSSDFAKHLSTLGLREILVVTGPTVVKTCGEILSAIQKAGINVTVHSEITAEPTVAAFEKCLRVAQSRPFDGVIGIGGGSAMDVAKLVAALAKGSQSLSEVFGINLLRERKIFLACLPTISGTGSEVSPNAILLDESSRLKKAVISPCLVPDVACVDPLLTCSAPAAITAAAGVDALSHCIEAYANKFAHPVIDLYALEGIRLVSANLLAAIQDGKNIEARANLALGSLYGGLCLGPVNTAAVHALAYPLGSEFHVGHGVSIAVLLPHVLRFNLSADPKRYADIAVAMDTDTADSDDVTAERGIEKLEQLIGECPIPRRLSALEIPREVLPQLAKSALTVTRLLKNNPRIVTEDDAVRIYNSAY